MYWIMFFHWISDFVLQNRWMAENKSKDTVALGMHVAVYTVAMFSMCTFLFGVIDAMEFVALNGAFHFLTDYVTSKFSTYFYEKKNFHAFFCVIGLDQFLHFAVLMITAQHLRLIS